LNNLDAHQLKKSIPSQVDPRMNDARKRVSFENIHSRFLSSTLSRTGDRADVNETIDISKSQKLLSPHRKRTAAYTQATNKSSLKKQGRDLSSHSAKKDRDTTLIGLGHSTPAKFTQANKTIGTFYKLTK
jgi:hypothetical protein